MPWKPLQIMWTWYARWWEIQRVFIFRFLFILEVRVAPLRFSGLSLMLSSPRTISAELAAYSSFTRYAWFRTGKRQRPDLPMPANRWCRVRQTRKFVLPVYIKKFFHQLSFFFFFFFLMWPMALLWIGTDTDERCICWITLVDEMANKLGGSFSVLSKMSLHFCSVLFYLVLNFHRYVFLLECKRSATVIVEMLARW